MYKLAIFDLVGTTINDHGLVYEALADTVKFFGGNPSAANIQKWMGADKTTAIIELLHYDGINLSPTEFTPALEWFHTRLRHHYDHHNPEIYPGVMETLEFLQGKNIAIAFTTGFTKDIAHPLLESLAWDITKITKNIITSSDVQAGRPAPDMIQLAMRKLAMVDQHSVFSVGDTVLDIRSAKAAQVTSIAVLTGKANEQELKTEQPDFLLSGVAQIPEIFNKPELFNKEEEFQKRS